MKILVVDDHILIREAMLGVLKELESGAVVLSVGSAREASELLELHADVSLLLLDLRLPDRDGLEFLTELREKFPAISVVMMSGFNDRDNVVRALDAGALGFIPKTEPREVLLGALRLILAGGIYIPTEILGRQPLPPVAPRQELSPQSPVQPEAEPPARSPTPDDLGLTERQVEVLALMMQGKSNKLICRALDLAEPTVKNHVSAILKALGVTNRTEAVLAVANFGWKLPRLGQ